LRAKTTAADADMPKGLTQMIPLWKLAVVGVGKTQDPQASL